MEHFMTEFYTELKNKYQIDEENQEEERWFSTKKKRHAPGVWLQRLTTNVWEPEL